MKSTPRTHNELIRVLYQMGLQDTLAASLLIRQSRDRLREQVTKKPIKKP